MTPLLTSIFAMSLCSCAIIPIVLLLRLFLKKAPKWINVLLWGIVALSLVVTLVASPTIADRIDEFMVYLYASSSKDSTPEEDPVPNPPDEEPSPLPPVDPDPETGATAPANDPDTQPSADTSLWMQILSFGRQLWNEIMKTIHAHLTDLSILWGAGIVLMLSYSAVSYWHLRRKIATAVRRIDNIYQSENVSFPFVLGIFIPRIYLPFKISVQDLEHVIAHERAHIRRKDHWWKPLGFLMLTVQWFNPLMWLAYILLCRDIELACDEKVIRELRNEQRADYTQSLVHCSIKRHTVTACPLAFGAVGVTDRVKAVMNYRKPTLWIKLTSIITCIVVSTLSLTLAVCAALAMPFAMPSDCVYYPVSGGCLLFEPASGTIVGYIGSPSKIEIPSEINGVAVEAIDNGAFRFCESLTSVFIADGVKTIGGFAFAHCPNLSHIDIPDSVRTIGRLAFRLCESLRSIDLPEGLDSIGNEAFAYSGLRDVTIPASVKTIGSGAFFMCSNLQAIRVDEDNPNYSSDENGVLFNKDQTELHTYPAALEGSYAIPSSVTMIASYAFSGSSLSHVDISNNVTVLGTAAFYHCSNLTSIILPDGMAAINNSVFSKCSNLIDISIPDSVTAIGNSVFSGCNNLTNIYFCGSAKQWELLDNSSYNQNYCGAAIHYNVA